MFFVVIAVLFILVGTFGALRYKILEKQGYYKEHETPDGDWSTMALVFYLIALLILVLSCVVTMVSYSGQISDFEEIKKIENVSVLYEKRAKVLTEQFAGYLLTMYPDHEREIFKNISPKKMDLYLVKYPELRSSETITTLVGQVRSLQDAYYKELTKREAVLKDIRYRQVDPWLFYWLIPNQ